MNKEQENQAVIEKKANEEKLQLQIKEATSDVEVDQYQRLLESSP